MFLQQITHLQSPPADFASFKTQRLVVERQTDIIQQVLQKVGYLQFPHTLVFSHDQINRQRKM